MLKRIKIQGYKSLADVEVPLDHLAVLIGPNASGKSNFLTGLGHGNKQKVEGRARSLRWQSRKLTVRATGTARSYSYFIPAACRPAARSPAA